MNKDIEWYVIPALDREYCVSNTGIFPVKVFSANQIGKELKKTPNVFKHPEEDLDIAFSYPGYFKRVDNLSLEEITDGVSLMKAVAYNHFINHHIEELDPEIFPDQPLYLNHKKKG